MKIADILARHPWPWRVVSGGCSGKPSWWQVYDAKSGCVFDDGSVGGEFVYSCYPATRDAILELVEANINNNKEPKQ